jgi:hypothetical protein
MLTLSSLTPHGVGIIIPIRYYDPPALGKVCKLEGLQRWARRHYRVGTTPEASVLYMAWIFPNPTFCVPPLYEHDEIHYSDITPNRFYYVNCYLFRNGASTEDR